MRFTDLLDVMAQTHEVETWLRNAGFRYKQVLSALQEHGKEQHDTRP